MNQNNRNKSKSPKDKVYLTYNQITKEYDVQILSDDEYNSLSKEQRKEIKHIVLTFKSKTTPPDPKEPPAWFLLWAEQNRKEMNAKFNDLREEIKNYVDQKIDDLAKKNNLKVD